MKFFILLFLKMWKIWRIFGFELLEIGVFNLLIVVILVSNKNNYNKDNEDKWSIHFRIHVSVKGKNWFNKIVIKFHYYFEILNSKKVVKSLPFILLKHMWTSA